MDPNQFSMRTPPGRACRRFVQLALFMMFAILCFSGSALAVSGYLSSFNSLYPTSTTGTTGSWSTTSNRCNVCHSAGGGSDLNAYGEAFAAAGHSFTAIEGLNSDGSSMSNLDEIKASAQPGWKPGAANTFYDITLPGSGTIVAVNQPPPSGLIGSADPVASPPPTTTTTTTTTTTAATTTTTAPTTTTTAPTTTTTQATTTSTAPTTTTTAATTTTTAPTTTTTTTKATTTTTAPTTTTTRATTTTTAPTTTTTKATTTTTKPTTTTTTKRTTTTTRRPTTTTTRRTTTTTASATTTTLPSIGATLYDNYCADCHSGAASLAGGRNVLGARVCSIDGAINGTSIFPNGVPSMQWLQGTLSDADIQAIADALNANPVTGQQRYMAACAGCHGTDARGGRVGESVKGARAGDILEAIHEERPMGYLGCLPASDVKDIGSYLQGNSRNGGKNRHSSRRDD